MKTVNTKQITRQILQSVVLWVALACCAFQPMAADNLSTGNGDLLKRWAGVDSASSEPKFLTVDEAFQLTFERLDEKTGVLRWQVTPAHYLYKGKIKFRSGDGKDLNLAATFPVAKSKNDEFFGLVDVYDHDFEIPVTLPSDGSLTVLQVEYQGCADAGLCYPPQTVEFQLGGTTDNKSAQNEPPEPPGWLGAIFFAFVTGLALTFTPCVLPMVPILSGVIVSAQGAHPTKTKGLLLSVAYVLGTVTTYAAAGAIAGATGNQLQAFFQNTWAIGLFAALFTVLALGMLGAWELKIPSALQTGLNNSTSRFKAGSLLGSYFIGLISALIIGACVGPLVIGVLGLAMERHDPVLGAVMMAAMAVGMGVFLILFGLGAGFLLPKAGAWMTTINQVFGFVLLGVAIYTLGALPQVPVLFLWGAFLVLAGVFFGAIEPLPQASSPLRKSAKALALLLLIWGVFALIGGLYGERDPLKPLPTKLVEDSWISNEKSGAAPDLFVTIKHNTALDQQFAIANTENKPLILDFYATWCNDCVKMVETTFARPDVRTALSGYRLVKADVTENNSETRQIKQRFNVYGPPATLFFDHNGSEVKSLRIYGYLNEANFLAHLARFSELTNGYE